MSRREPLLVVAALVCLGLVVGSGGFSTVSAERGFSVAVADDGNAYLGVQTHAPELRNGNHDVALVTVTNRFPTAIVDVDATIRSAKTPRPPRLTGHGLEPPSAPISVGESAAVTARVTCGANPGGTSEFAVHLTAVTATGSTVELERGITVTCTGEPNRGASGRDRRGSDDETTSNDDETRSNDGETTASDGK